MDGSLPQHAVGEFVFPVLVGVLASMMCHFIVSWTSWPGWWCCGTWCDGQCHFLCSLEPASLIFKVVCGCGLNFLTLVLVVWLICTAYMLPHSQGMLYIPGDYVPRVAWCDSAGWRFLWVGGQSSWCWDSIMLTMLKVFWLKSWKVVVLWTDHCPRWV